MMPEPIQITVNGDEVTIKVKLTAGTPSSTGKSLVVATSNGFVPVAGSDIKVSLNIIKPRR